MCICMCMGVCMCVCDCVCMCVRVHACMCMCICVCTSGVELVDAHVAQRGPVRLRNGLHRAPSSVAFGAVLLLGCGHGVADGLGGRAEARGH
jgi:hypothetical protein